MSGKQHFIALDGLRGVAALAVVMMHAAELYRVPTEPAHAALAVDFFFCLSGFVIAHAYDERLASGHLTRIAFARQRFNRLYPMILLGTILGGLALLSSATHGAPQPLWRVAFLTISSALLLPAGVLFNLDIFAVNVPLWSLFFEGIANAVYGASGGRAFSRTSYLAALLVTALALSAVVAAERYDLGPSGVFLSGSARVAFSFLAGVVLCRSGLVARAPKVPMGVLALVLAAILFGPTVHLSWLYDLAAILVVFPVLVALGARTEAARWTSLWRFLGEVSYPVYALHYPVLQLFLKVNNHALHLAPAPAATLAVAVAFAASWGAYEVYDKPLRRWLNERSGDKARALALA